MSAAEITIGVLIAAVVFFIFGSGVLVGSVLTCYSNKFKWLTLTLFSFTVGVIAFTLEAVYPYNVHKNQNWFEKRFQSVLCRRTNIQQRVYDERKKAEPTVDSFIDKNS
jgi:uncharacterized membrane protein